MALTSASTRQDAIDQYNDNLSWEGSPSRAVLALEALRYLKVNRPTQISRDQVSSFSYANIDEEIAKLETYVSRQGSAVSNKRVSFTKGRAL